jgi:hypothetical protein
MLAVGEKFNGNTVKGRSSHSYLCGICREEQVYSDVTTEIALFPRHLPEQQDGFFCSEKPCTSLPWNIASFQGVFLAISPRNKKDSKMSQMTEFAPERSLSPLGPPSHYPKPASPETSPEMLLWLCPLETCSFSSAFRKGESV